MGVNIFLLALLLTSNVQQLEVCFSEVISLFIKSIFNYKLLHSPKY